MAGTIRQPRTVEFERIGPELRAILSELEADPDIAFQVIHDQTSTAIVLHPAVFRQLLDAAEEVLDLADAEIALATEPLESFADYHTRRMQRRQQVAG